MKLSPLCTVAPVYSPLVAKAGMLHRQTTVFRVWKKVAVVLTVDGYLHVFEKPSDVLCTELELDKLAGVTFRWEPCHVAR